MQVFIASGRVAFIPNDAVDRTKNGHTSFKFEFVCDSSMTDDTNKPIPSFFHVQVYGKQAELMAQSLSKGSPILLKGEIIQRPYKEKLSNVLIMMNKINVGRISSFPQINKEESLSLKIGRHLIDVSRNNRDFLSLYQVLSLHPILNQWMRIPHFKGLESIQEHLCAFFVA